MTIIFFIIEKEEDEKLVEPHDKSEVEDLPNLNLLKILI
jgi:hypothetical protein